MYKSVHDLVAFQRALDLTVVVYDVTKSFPRNELYGLTSQLRRAAVGIPAQIAEGQGRLTNGEWRQFLSQARGSLFEVEAECMLAMRLGLLPADDFRRADLAVRRTGKALNGLIRWVRAAEQKPPQPRNPATPQPR